MNLFKSIIDTPDLEWEFIDGSIVKAHQHSAGANSKEQAIGESGWKNHENSLSYGCLRLTYCI